MKTLIQAIAVTGAVATPAFAQEAPQDVSGFLDALTCREFLAFEPQDQMNVMLAMRAHVSGDPLPDEPLPIGVEAEVGGADGLGGDSGDASAEGLDTTADGEGGEAAAATSGEAAATDGTEAASAQGTATGTAEATDGEAAEAEATGEGSAVGDEEVLEGENESGKVNPDGTEMSVTDEPTDPKLTAMRTSCEGGPDALATDAMRAAHADYE